MKCDPKLHKALETMQYSSQYITNCNELLHHRENTLMDALHVFDQEEAELDRALLKMK